MKDLVEITCYGQKEVLERKEALKKFKEGILCSEGSEQERYTTIYFELLDGLKVVSDHC